jgi:ketosteroid isomerase-like protein
MSSEQNLATTQGIYEAFGKGDMPGLLGALAEDVAWEQWGENHAQRAGVPWLEERRGRDGAGEFFGLVAGWEIHDFQVLSMLAGGEKVAVEILMDATPAGGSRFRDEELHVWTFGADGKVTQMRHYVDTAKHIAAAG